MALGKTALKGGLAAIMVVAMSAGAFAWEAFATASVNVRSGPGTNYRVVDVLQRNQVVDVEYCRSGWCFVNAGDRYGSTGWTSQNYLSRTGSGWQPPRPNPPQWEAPRPRPPQWQPPRPNPPHWQAPRPRPPQWHPNPPRPPHWNPRPPQHDNDRPNSQVCFNGPNGYVCIGN